MGVLQSIKSTFARFTPRFGWNFTKSPFFEQQCKKAFTSVDEDNDGALSKTELYVAILKLYDQLNAVMPTHIKIPTSREVDSMLYTFDKDKTGKLEFPEFLALCRSLAGGKGRFWNSLMFKALAVVTLKVIILPVAAKGIKEGLMRVAPADYVKPVPDVAIAVLLEMAVKGNVPLPM